MFVDVLYSKLECIWEHRSPFAVSLENLVAIENKLLDYYTKKGKWFAVIIKKKITSSVQSELDQ